MSQLTNPATFAKSLIRCLLLASIATLLSAVCVNAQVSATDSSTPAGLAAGAPAGSYQLSGFDNINFFNGNLNFNLPLLKVGGRGGVQDTIGLTLEQKWKTVTTPRESDFYIYPVPYTWDGLEVGYGPGVLIGRFAGIPTSDTCEGLSTCEGAEAAHSLLRLTFKASDGTEYELLDTAHGGAPGVNTTCFQNCVLASAENRGTEFVSHDGTSATFISDNNLFDAHVTSTGYILEQIFPSGYLMLRDGTRYRIEDGLVKWIRDRNGNKMTFAYDSNGRVTQITDSIGRVVTISYASSALPSSDVITYRGFGNVAREIHVHRDLLYNSSSDNSLRSDATLKTYYQLFPLNGSSTSTYFNPIVVTSVELPNEQSYRFKYNSYGELARVELPTGGAMEYDHEGGLAADEGMYTVGGYRFPTQIYRRVVERRVFADSGATWENRMTISKPETSSTNAGYVIVDNKDYAGTLINREVHYYYGTAKVNGSADPSDPDPWKTGREWKTELYDNNGTTVLRRTEKTWQQPAAGYSWPLTNAETSDAAGPNNPQVTQSVTTLVDTSSVSKQIFAFDQYNNTSDVYEFDFGSGSPGSLVRRTHTDYLTGSSYTSAASQAYLLSLPTQQSVFDASSTERARTSYEYDNYTPDSNHDNLLPRSSIFGLDSAFSTSYTTRGNSTKTTQYVLNSSGTVVGSISGYAQFDIAGNVVKAIDARGYATNFDYRDNFGAPADSVESGGNPVNTAPSELSGSYAYAFPFAVTNALGQTIYAKLDYQLGRVVTSEDINGIVSRGYFNDALDRPSQGIRTVNGGTDTRSQTTFAYDDTNHIITTTSDQTTYGDNVLKSQTIYDGLGRPIESRQYESSSQYIAVNQVPFVMRQDPDTGAWLAASESSNPHRSNEQPIYSTSFADALGRIIKLRTPDNAIVRTAYSGNTVTVTDQAAMQRKSESDALGRLTKVYEDPNGLNYLTNYSYDPLDDLTGVSQYDPVSQYTQTRTFVYDSLKRLTSAKHPEMVNQQGQQVAVTYQYDNNGNLTQKTDPRGVVTTFAAYDALNRPTGTSYSDGTPSVNYFYDSQSLPSGAPSYSRGFSTGRLVAVTYGGGSQGDYFGFDEAGRTRRKYQQTGGVNYLMTANYNVAGAMTSETYPSTNGVAYGYDTAGRLNSFTGNLGEGGSGRNYSTEITYSPFGITKEKFGTGTTPIYTKLLYNIRGQLGEIRAGTTYTGASDTSWNRGAIVNSYSSNYGCWGASCNAPDNNGNLKSQDYFIPTVDTPQPASGQYVNVSQQFDYDALNRLEDVHEGSAWQQRYTYDRFGNRKIAQGSTETFGNNIPKPNYGVDYTTNRLTAPSGTSMTYDTAGNLTYDSTNGSQGDRVFDAENRMTSARGALNAAWQYYAYDGEGKRVKRQISNGETWEVYGLGGELVAEYTSSGMQLTKEYGYRSGQLLITAAVASNGWGAPPVIHDNPLQAGSTTVQSRHITELRDAINALRSHLGMSQHTWNTSANVGDWITAAPILEMRVALDEALGSPSPAYTAGLAQNQPILAAHVQELRNRVLGAWNSGTGGTDIRWLIDDQLGTPRIVLDQNGSFSGTTRHDYLPFGEELVAGGRTWDHGYTNYDANRQRFTGYERDDETDLDYAQARYFSHGQGRFTSVDPLGKSANIFDPQTFNRYSYVLNNPLNFADPTGRQGKPKNKPAKKEGDAWSGESLPGMLPNPGPVALVNVTAPPETIVYEFEIELNPGVAPAVPAPATAPAPAPEAVPWFAGLTELLGAFGFILANPVTMGGGDTNPAPAVQTDTSANPEDNKPDTGDRTDDRDFPLYRFGWPAESAESLADQAAAAEANPGYQIHGVSVNAVPKRPGPFAMKSEIEKFFPVKKTGRDPGHYTVVLPKPVTPDTARTFNLLFKRGVE